MQPDLDRFKSILESKIADFVATSEVTGVLIESLEHPAIRSSHNENRSFPAASVTKLAIACAAAESHAQGRISLEDRRALSSMNDTAYCSIMKAFNETETLSIRTLIGLMLIVSDNPATTAILDVLGQTAVNEWLVKHGFETCKLFVSFEDEFLGDPMKVNHITPLECLKLLRIIHERSNLSFVKKMLINNLRNDRIPRLLPDDVRTAHKTGTLNGVMNDVGIVYAPTFSFVLVVLAEDVLDATLFATQIAKFSADIYQTFDGFLTG